MSTVITSIDHPSAARRAGVRPGEKLISIGGHEIVDVLDGRLIVRTVDGSLLIEEYEYDGKLQPKDRLE